MAVLVQQQLATDAAFVLHTRSPLGGDGALLAEVALGMGETLAAGTRGSPWRLSVNKASGARAARRRGLTMGLGGWRAAGRAPVALGAQGGRAGETFRSARRRRRRAPQARAAHRRRPARRRIGRRAAPDAPRARLRCGLARAR